MLQQRKAIRYELNLVILAAAALWIDFRSAGLALSSLRNTTLYAADTGQGPNLGARDLPFPYLSIMHP